jgi:hypothetical protein
MNIKSRRVPDCSFVGLKRFAIFNTTLAEVLVPGLDGRLVNTLGHQDGAKEFRYRE